MCFLQDDLIDDIDKLVAAAVCLKEQGSYKVYVLATHGLLAPDSAVVEKLNESPIDEVSVNVVVIVCASFVVFICAIVMIQMSEHLRDCKLSVYTILSCLNHLKAFKYHNESSCKPPPPPLPSSGGKKWFVSFKHVYPQS